MTPQTPDTVDYQHPQYAEYLPSWQQTADAVAGSRAIKDKGEQYLPRPNPTDKSAEALARYTNYLARAVYTNYVGRTHDGLIGVAFAAPPRIALSEELAYLVDDANGAGTGLAGQTQRALSCLLQHGRAGILVDYPQLESPVSRYEQWRGGAGATLNLYDAESIINWRSTRIGSRHQLSLVVLAETCEIDGEFSASSETQYRVLRLALPTRGDPDPRPVYFVEIWRQRDGAWVMTESFMPRDSAGEPWTEIPFQFLGATNNDAQPDKAPLYDLAVLNLAHYRNSADYEDAAFLAGQPTPYMTGLDAEWRDHLEKQGIYFGSRAVLTGPTGASIGLLQAAPNNLIGEAMRGKEEQMAALGARLLQPGAAAKTAAQSYSEDAAFYSVLSLCCANLNQAYRQALAWAARFVYGTLQDDLPFALKTDFTDSAIDAPELSAIVAAWQAGKLPDADGWAYLRRLGLIRADKSDEEVKGEIAGRAATQ